MGSRRFGADPHHVEFDVDVANLEAGDHFSLLSRNNICRPELRNGSCTGHVESISWCLHDFMGTALASDELPTEPLDLTNWQSLVGLRIEGTATDRKSNAESSFLITARVLHTESLAR